MVMDDEPLSALILPDHGPAEGCHIVFSAFHKPIFLYGRRAPGHVAIAVNLGVIVDCKFGAFIASQQTFTPDSYSVKLLYFSGARS